MRVLSLCSGYGGLELALSQAFPGRSLDMVAVCDSYGPARTVLAAHWAGVEQFKDVHDQALNSVQADVVTFGFPCQDLSRAGNGAGLGGSRSGLFFRCAEIGHLSGASVLIIENVPQVSRYRNAVDGELSHYGFTVRWGRAEAWEAGANHRRARVFLAAVRDGWESLLSGAVQPDTIQSRPEGLLPTPTVVDMGWGRTERESGRTGERRSAPGTATVTDTDSPCTRRSDAPIRRRLSEQWSR